MRTADISEADENEVYICKMNPNMIHGRQACGLVWVGRCV